MKNEIVQKTNKRPAFTLIEMMVVSGILLIVMGISIKAFIDIQRATQQIQYISWVNDQMRAAMRHVKVTLDDTRGPVYRDAFPWGAAVNNATLIRRYIGGAANGGYRIRVAGGICAGAVNYFAGTGGDRVVVYPPLVIDSCTNVLNGGTGQWEATCVNFNAANPQNSVDNAWDTTPASAVMMGLDYQPALAVASRSQDLLIRCGVGQAPVILARNVKRLNFTCSSDDPILTADQVRVTAYVESPSGGLARPYNLTESKVLTLRN